MKVIIFLASFIITVQLSFGQSEEHSVLINIDNEIQTDRKQSEEVSNKYGWESKEMDALRKTVLEHDSINLNKLKAIVEKGNWYGNTYFGEQIISTLFSIIHFSDLAIQEKYLPLMREVVLNNKIEASSLAVIEDQVAVEQGKKQIYGSRVSVDKKTQLYMLRH